MTAANQMHRPLSIVYGAERDHNEIQPIRYRRVRNRPNIGFPAVAALGRNAVFVVGGFSRLG